ncbi:MAG: hypothetical protein WD749_02795 [Phycisphaerales bacterium]
MCVSIAVGTLFSIAYLLGVVCTWKETDRGIAFSGSPPWFVNAGQKWAFEWNPGKYHNDLLLQPLGSVESSGRHNPIGIYSGEQVDDEDLRAEFDLPEWAEEAIQEYDSARAIRLEARGLYWVVAVREWVYIESLSQYWRIRWEAVVGLSIVIAGTSVVVVTLLRIAVAVYRVRNNCCYACGYCAASLPSARCPECGSGLRWLRQ